MDQQVQYFSFSQESRKVKSQLQKRNHNILTIKEKKLHRTHPLEKRKAKPPDNDFSGEGCNYTVIPSKIFAG